MSDYSEDSGNNSESSQSDSPTDHGSGGIDVPGQSDVDAVSNTVTFFAGGQSVIKSLESRVIQLPRIVLQDVESDQGEPLAKPNSSAMPTVGDQVGRYQLIGEIARGGMGAVLRGRDMDLGRDLAIKVLLEDHVGRPDVLQRFVEEAQISGQLQHPGIAPVYELGQFADKRPFFSMKLVKGKTLSTLLSDRAAPDEERARFLGVFEQVCQTVAYAHSRGVIHRDIKPSNVMVGSFGEVQVMDWGLAKVMKAGGVEDDRRVHQTKEDLSVIRTIRSEQVDTPGYGSQTHAGSVLGTPAYMAPEQAMGEVDQLDERSDVFGLGALLCEILTGKPPYVADTGNKVFKLAIRANLEDAIQRLDNCGADAKIIRLAKQCLSVEPADRPRDAAILAEHIADYFESVRDQLAEAKLATVKAEARAVEEHKRQRITLTLASALVATLVMAAAGWEFVSRQNSVRERGVVEQRARLTSQIVAALADAELYRAKAEALGHNDPVPLLQAQQAVARAETLAATDDVDAGLLEQIATLKQALKAEATDRQIVAALERARTERVEMKGRLHNASFETITNAYRKALADFGINVGEDSADAVVGAIQQRRDFVQTALVAAIDDWLLLATRGTGIRVRQINGQHVITSVEKNGPADGSGIRKDDILLGVSPEGDRDEIVSLRGRSISDVLELFSGDAGERLLLQVMTPIPQSSAKSSLLAIVSTPRIVSLTRGRDLRAWLRDIAVQMDPKPWRIRLRMAVDQMVTAELMALAVEKSATSQPSSAIVSLALALVESGEHGAGINLLKQAQRKQPHDFWINYTLGTQLHYSNPPRYQDAIRYYTAALAIRPQSAGIGLNLGDVYDGVGELDEAIASYRNAVDAQPDDEKALMSLGNALTKRVNDDTEFSMQIASADVSNEGRTRMFADNVELASRSPVSDPLEDDSRDPRRHKFSIRPIPAPPGGASTDGATENAPTRPKSVGAAKADNNDEPALGGLKPGDLKTGSLPQRLLGKAMGRMSSRGGRYQTGQSVQEAEQVLTKLVKMNPESAEARCCLAKVLQHKGQYADAVEHFRKGHELAQKNGSRLPTDELLADAECLAAWGKNLEQLLKKSVTGEIDHEFHSRMCRLFKHNSMTATKLFAATQLEDEFLHDVYRGHRLASARTAVLAANISWPREGVTVDATEIDKQAAEWLDADLQVIEKRLKSDMTDKQRASISRMLQQWRGNSVFSSVKTASGKKRFPKLAIAWERAGKLIAQVEELGTEE